uniref:Sterol 24-C-methyltransferase-like n=1 Tax=Saccoglossus kowalevskii TaxID=10224 RepID=A0ABM0MLD5_SACKO|nr:PREDICTED: sterol 24-C-methyltransferase-like [Saccoglossus kowalevskii]
MLCEAYDQVSDCFKTDGPQGVAYDQYPKFQDFMHYMSNIMHNKTLLTDFVGSVPELEELLETGVTVLDVGCGKGRAPMILAQKFPRSSFYGIDISASAISAAQIEAEEMSLTNIHFQVHDAASLPCDWTDKFEYVTALDCIHDQAEPLQVLHEIRRVLKPGGTFSMLEIAGSSRPNCNIGNPRAIDGYVISLFHCMPVSLYFDGGKGLGTMWGRENVLQVLEECGFSEIIVRKSRDSFNYHFVSKSHKCPAH